MGVLNKFIALLLVTLWPAVTSHTLLTHGGLIHVVHVDHGHEGDAPHSHHDHDDDSHEHNGDNHAVADGDYRSNSNSKLIVKPSASTDFRLLAGLILPLQERENTMRSPGPAPPGSLPQILRQTWQFSLRAAIQGRAPSLIS